MATRTIELKVVDNPGAPASEEVNNPVSVAAGEGAGVIAALAPEDLDRTKGSCCSCFSSSGQDGGGGSSSADGKRGPVTTRSADGSETVLEDMSGKQTIRAVKTRLEEVSGWSRHEQELFAMDGDGEPLQDTVVLETLGSWEFLVMRDQPGAEAKRKASEQLQEIKACKAKVARAERLLRNGTPKYYLLVGLLFTLIFAAVFALPLGFSSAAVYLGPRYSLDADRLLNADRSEDGGVLYGRSKSKVARWWTHPDYCKEKRCDLLPPLPSDGNFHPDMVTGGRKVRCRTSLALWSPLMLYSGGKGYAECRVGGGDGASTDDPDHGNSQVFPSMSYSCQGGGLLFGLVAYNEGIITFNDYLPAVGESFSLVCSYLEMSAVWTPLGPLNGCAVYSIDGKHREIGSYHGSFIEYGWVAKILLWGYRCKVTEQHILHKLESFKNDEWFYQIGEKDYTRCDDSCGLANNGKCDSGWSADGKWCNWGTDCTDCGKWHGSKMGPPAAMPFLQQYADTPATQTITLADGTVVSRNSTANALSNSLQPAYASSSYAKGMIAVSTLMCPIMFCFFSVCCCALTGGSCPFGDSDDECCEDGAYPFKPLVDAIDLRCYGGEGKDSLEADIGYSKVQIFRLEADMQAQQMNQLAVESEEIDRGDDADDTNEKDDRKSEEAVAGARGVAADTEHDGRAQDRQQQAQEPWTCQACTLVNEAGALKCAACGADPPPPGAGATVRALPQTSIGDTSMAVPQTSIGDTSMAVPQTSIGDTSMAVPQTRPA